MAELRRRMRLEDRDTQLAGALVLLKSRIDPVITDLTVGQCLPEDQEELAHMLERVAQQLRRHRGTVIDAPE